MSNITANERELLLIALRWRRRYEDACPDVGMGPLNRFLLDDLIEDAGMTVDDGDKDSIMLEFGEYSDGYGN